MEQPATHAGSAADDEQREEQQHAKGVPQETISATRPDNRFPLRREELPSVPPEKRPRTSGLPADLASPRPRGLTRASSSARRCELYKKTERSVVKVMAQATHQFMNQRFPKSESQAAALRKQFPQDPLDLNKGSGFVWDDEGHVVTNYHVIDKAQQVSVAFWEGGDQYVSYHANLCHVEPDELKKNDIAVLKVWAPRDGLRPITCGSSSKLRVGDRVYALGSPEGLHFSLAPGTVSQFRHGPSGLQIHGYCSAPGSSGSPLLDENGLLVGVNTSGVVGTGYHNAVPVDAVRRIIDRETYFPIARSKELIDNHYPIHKYQNALARAKDALIKIRDGRDTASADHMAAMARNTLTEISKALAGNKL